MKQFSDFKVAHNFNDMEQYLHQGWQVVHIFYEPDEQHYTEETYVNVANPQGYGASIKVPKCSVEKTIIINRPKFIMACTPAVKVLYDENNRTDFDSN